MKYEKPQEFQDVFKILEFGIQKGYSADGWLKGDKFNDKDNDKSMLRHLIKQTTMDKSEIMDLVDGCYQDQANDDESGYSHLLHLACRALMKYTVQKREVMDITDFINNPEGYMGLKGACMRIAEQNLREQEERSDEEFLRRIALDRELSI